MKKVNLTILVIILVFIKEITEEISFIKENSRVILLIITIIGILPSLGIGILYKILGL